MGKAQTIQQGINASSHTKSKPPIAPVSDFFENTAEHKVGDKIFIVEPVFKKEGDVSIGSILLKLMKADI